MKRKLHFGTAAVGVVGIVIYTICAMVVKRGFSGRGIEPVSNMIRQAGQWLMIRLNVPLFQVALIAAGLAALLIAPLGLPAAFKGRAARTAGYCTGLGLVLFGAMLVLDGLMYRPFFITGGAMPGHILYTKMSIINMALMLGVAAANAGGIFLGIFGFMENRRRDTLLEFLLLSMALVFAGSFMWQLLWMVLAVMSRRLYDYFAFIAPLGLPFVLLAAVHVRGGMLEGRG